MSSSKYPELLVSDEKGKIYNVPFLAAVGMKGYGYERLSFDDLVKLPHGSQLFRLPCRKPVAIDLDTGQYVQLDRDPLSRNNKPCFPVAAFVSPGYTVTHNTAYIESGRVALLPLFAYAAVAFYRGDFYAACTRVDRERRQDIRYMNSARIKRHIKQFRKLFPSNRLMRHLEDCALINGCPAARNFFLKRYEGPLPTSLSCNARCLGCLSLQPDKDCPIAQPRIKFIPSAEEIAETALFHIRNVKDPVVSFGQGCEGEPLLAGAVIEQAIKLIRRKTTKGVINLNTNASQPAVVARLFDAGLDSMRVSLNSVRQEYYDRYYRPRGYAFKDVAASVRAAKKRQGFVSLNYLTIPGFTDVYEEVMAFQRFLDKYPVDMIQWRNLNFDPRGYFRRLKCSPPLQKMLGIKNVIHSVHRDFPHLMKGYFNPARGRMRRWASK